MAQDIMAKAGEYAFVGGVVLALVVGFLIGFGIIGADLLGTVSIIMVVLGLIVGAMNITDKEVNSFVIAAIGLSASAVALRELGVLLKQTAVTAGLGASIEIAFTVFAVFVAGAVLIPALKAVIALSKN